MSDWKTIGNLGDIIEKEDKFIVNIAENRYKKNPNTKKLEKISVIWFNCICDFKPNMTKGDLVICDGEFIPCITHEQPYLMKIKHIGLLKKCDRDSEENNQTQKESSENVSENNENESSESNNNSNN